MRKTSKGYGPQQVARFLPKVAGPVLAKKGFPNMALLTEWPTIIGAELADCTCPEKLSWPRQPRDVSPDEAPPARRSKKPPKGIVLKLRVEPHAALDVQYRLDEIFERINRYFGYRAVTEIRIIQGPVTRDVETPRKNPDLIKSTETKPLADFDRIRDEGLREALKRLDEARRG